MQEYEKKLSFSFTTGFFSFQNHPFQAFLVSKTYFVYLKKENIFAHMSVKARGGGLKALADMFAKNVSCFGRLPNSLPLFLIKSMVRHVSGGEEEPHHPAEEDQEGVQAPHPRHLRAQHLPRGGVRDTSTQIRLLKKVNFIIIIINCVLNFLSPLPPPQKKKIK